MKLQILIPQYKETDEILKPLLDSISLQQGMDMSEIGVIICNDGSNVRLSNEFLGSYPFPVEYHLCDHKGVSATRNACLDRATADYVMFCDADDMFYSVCGLHIILREIDNGGFDSLVSVFIEETRHPETKEVLFVNHDQDSTFVHGKVHKRSYLIDRNIRFSEKLTIHEDSYFNILCQTLSENVKYCPVPFYLWKWRDESVCRHDPKYILKTYRNMLESNDELIKTLNTRGYKDKARFFVAFMIFDAYYNMNKPEWINQENKEYRDTTELKFAEWFVEHKEQWDEIPANERAQISAGVRTRSVGEGMEMEIQTISQWLDYIKSLKEDKDNT